MNGLIDIFRFNNRCVYSPRGKLHFIKNEYLDIEFLHSTGPSSPILKNALGPINQALFSIGFNVLTTHLENEVKKYTATYTKQKSDLDSTINILPDIVFQRKVVLKGKSKFNTALKFWFKPKRLENISDPNLFVYYLHDFELHYSSAKAKRKHNTFDYIIEIQLSTLNDKIIQTQKLLPLIIRQLSFNKSSKLNPDEFSSSRNPQHFTNCFSFPSSSALTGVYIKITETNPYKNSAEKVLSFWKENKTHIQNIIISNSNETK